MFNFNPKLSIQKYPIFCRWYNVFSANVSDFFHVFYYEKLDTLNSHISTKN